MKSNNILLYFRNKGENEYINLMTSQNIIQENVLFPSEYIYIGNELEDNLEITELHDDSIYIFTNSTVQKTFECKNFLKEFSEYGKNFYKICKSNMNFLNIYSSIDFLMESIDRTDKTLLLNEFKKYCKCTHIPVYPKEINFKNNCDGEIKLYELEFDTIKTIIFQHILIYILFTLKNNYLYFFNEITLSKVENELGIENPIFDTYSLFEESELSQIKNRLSETNEFISLLHITLSNFTLEYIYKANKKKIKNIFLENALVVFNKFDDKFHSETRTYFSIVKHQIITQKVYSNLLDICWYLLIEEYKNFDITIGYCTSCGKTIAQNTDSHICHKCRNKQKISPSKKTQEDKKDLINNIIFLLENNEDLRENSQILEKAITYKSLLQKGNSKKLEQTSKIELENFLNDIRNYSK